MAVLHFGFDGEKTNPIIHLTSLPTKWSTRGRTTTTPREMVEAQNEVTQAAEALLEPDEDPVSGLIRLSIESPAMLTILLAGPPRP